MGYVFEGGEPPEGILVPRRRVTALWHLGPSRAQIETRRFLSEGNRQMASWAPRAFALGERREGERLAKAG